MLQTAIFIILSVLFLGGVAIVSVRRLKKTETALKDKNKELERRLYELSVSQAVSQQIGYSLQIQHVIESIIEATSHAVEHSAISYALVDGKTITVKTLEKNFLGPHFLDEVKKRTIDMVYSHIQDPHSYEVIASVQKEVMGETGIYNDDSPASFFGLPLLINGRCIGALSLASTTLHAFSEEDQALIGRIIENTLETVGRLEEVIHTEKAKLDSFLFSLTSGALLFLINGDILKLSAMNLAARQFLHLPERVDTTMVIAHFGMHHDLIQDIKDTAIQKKSMIIKNVSIYERSFKIYLNPVFLPTEDKIIGVSVTMEDVTFEHDIEQMRETFTSMVVHELRAPLTSIKGASQLLLDGKLKKEDMNKMLHIVHDSTEHMLMDIGDILDMSKLEAGKFTLNKSFANINKVVQEKMAVFSFVAQERHITINSHLDEKITDSVFDAQRIGQVLNNLFSNALKFTPDNGTITASTSIQNGQILVSVHDTGQGVPDEKKALLFSKYGQLSGSIRHEGGTGLGLYISKGVVESHGGKIWLDSKPGDGTTFSFTLPIVTKLEEGEQPVQAPKKEEVSLRKMQQQKVVN